MLLNLLKRLRIHDIAIAGMDGFEGGDGRSRNYFDASFDVERLIPQFDEINKELYAMLADYAAAARDSCTLSFLTPSIFARVFADARL
jgi:hypothetical protein